MWCLNVKVWVFSQISSAVLVHQNHKTLEEKTGIHSKHICVLYHSLISSQTIKLHLQSIVGMDVGLFFQIGCFGVFSYMAGLFIWLIWHKLSDFLSFYCIVEIIFLSTTSLFLIKVLFSGKSCKENCFSLRWHTLILKASFSAQKSGLLFWRREWERERALGAFSAE